MKFLAKDENSIIINESLRYDNSIERKRIREILKSEQKGFCAYSERFLMHTDSVEVEHFDGRIKETEQDNYFNWYAVIRWMNSHKPKKIDPFLPILLPYEDNLNERIKYEDGIYSAIDENDREASNLINYLGLNKHELYIDRKKHVSRMRSLLEIYNNDIGQLVDHLRNDKRDLSFITALEVELDSSFEELLDE